MMQRLEARTVGVKPIKIGHVDRVIDSKGFIKVENLFHLHFNNPYPIFSKSPFTKWL